MARRKQKQKPGGAKKKEPRPHAALPDVGHQEPPIQTSEPELSTREEPAEEQGPKTPEEELSDARILLGQLDELHAANIEICEERKAVRARIAQLEAAVPPGEPAWHFWPKEEALPRHHVKVRRQPQPCRNKDCRRLYTKDGGQAVQCLQSSGTTASFRCMVCGKTFKLGVKVLKR